MGVKIYGQVDYRMPPRAIEDYARRVEAIGYDGLAVPDSVHDGFVAAYAALRSTTRLTVASCVVVAFPRSPMVTAVAAWDLAESSGGRYELGIGSQVRGNIVGRYSAPWDAPVSRMRDYVASLRAIFRAFQGEADLDHHGDHYAFTRLQPFFNPGPIEHPEIPIYLAAIGPRMTELAGEVADGQMTHSTNSDPEFLKALTLPSLARGRGDDRDPPELLVNPFIATGATEADVDAERERIRDLLGFLFTTPGYGRPLELHGWGDLFPRLRDLARAGKWDELGEHVTDEMLDKLVPSGCYPEIAEVLSKRYDGVGTRMFFPVPEDPRHDSAVAEVVAALQSGAV